MLLRPSGPLPHSRLLMGKTLWPMGVSEARAIVLARMEAMNARFNYATVVIGASFVLVSSYASSSSIFWILACTSEIA